MMKKKFISIFLCSIIVFGLVACGNKETNNLVSIEEDLTESVESDNAKSLETDEINEPDMADTSENNGLTGEFREFTALDIYGETVTEDILLGHKLVMINIWATFCSPCISEMPDLGELSEEYAEEDLLIIGICLDIYNENDQNTAVEIVEDTGANYTHLVVSDDLFNIYISGVQAVPETLFLDATGTIIGSSIGSNSKENWQEIIDLYLAEEIE